MDTKTAFNIHNLRVKMGELETKLCLSQTNEAVLNVVSEETSLREEAEHLLGNDLSEIAMNKNEFWSSKEHEDALIILQEQGIAAPFTNDILTI